MTGCEILNCQYFRNGMCQDDSEAAQAGWCRYNWEQEEDEQ